MRDIGIEQVPIGSKVLTPTGRVGIVIKHFTTSKKDQFDRVSVQFNFDPQDGVVLQPHLLTVIEVYKWRKPDRFTLHKRIEALCK